MTDEDEPLAPALALLVAHERKRKADAPAGALEQIEKNVLTAIRGEPLDTPAPQPLRIRGPLTTSWAVSAALAVGLVAGAALHSLFTKPVISPPVTVAPPTASPPRSIEPPATSSSTAIAASASPSSANTFERPARRTDEGLRPPPAPVASDSAGRAPSDDLRQQRAELVIARAALSRGDAAAALDALERHTATYPHSKLEEERAALRIHALVLAGRVKDARESAADFRQRYPTSLLLPSIERATRE
ncbi:MAG TPA: hypothetical protein VM925_27660 [Labilithrix sp.]|nr:hypothetical protein [Labilithrix sp.]